MLTHQRSPRALPRPARRATAGRMLASAALAACLSNTVSAHAPPAGTGVLLDPQGQVAIIVTNRGLIFHDEERDAYQLMCSEALGVDSSQTPHVVITAAGSLLAATFKGLSRSDDSGCTWQPVTPFESSNIPVMVADPSNADTVYLAGIDADTLGIHKTADGGASWVQLYSLGATDFLYALQVAPSDPNTLYASGENFGSTPSSFFVLHSSDGGSTWARTELPTSDHLYRYRVVAVAPEDPLQLLLISETLNAEQDPSQLFVSRDGGDTLTAVLQADTIADAGFSAQGQAWAASEEGLFVLSSDLASSTQLPGAYQLSCGAQDQVGLLVCGYYEADSLLPGVRRVVSVDGAAPAFAHFMDFGQVDMPITCPPDSPTTTACALPWYDWAREMLGQTPGTAAPGAVGADGTTPAPAPPNDALAPGAAAPSMSAGQADATSNTSQYRPASPPQASEHRGCSAPGRRSAAGTSRPFILVLATVALMRLVRRRRTPRPPA